MTFKKGHKSWIKGLTKYTDERVKNIGEKSRLNHIGKHPVEKARKKMSESRLKGLK